jgi:hypothetical protein
MYKIINFLLNRKLLLIIALIIAALFTFGFMMSGIYMGWSDLFWFAYTIGVIFVVAHYIPTLVSYLMEIHQHNLEDIRKQELQDVNCMSTRQSKVPLI